MTKYFLLLSLFIFAGCDNNFFPRQAANSKSSIIHDDTDCTAANTIQAQSTTPMLGILVSYKNISISSSNSTWSKKLFGKDQSQLNHYYLQNSNSNFEFSQAAENIGCTNDGIVSVVLGKNHPDTDIDSDLFNSRAYPDLTLALRLVDSAIDFSNYDSDANGHISADELLLTFIIAGYEDSYEGRHVTNGIWAHQFCMLSQNNIPTLDGVTLMDCQNDGNFALFGEKHERNYPYDATIGIIAHELGHSAFMLPDLYNTSGTTGGIGYFGLMGSGMWGQQNIYESPGNTPTHLSAWSKVFSGWVTPTIQNNTTVTLDETSSDSYNILKIPIDNTHYYLLENRNDNGYDKGLFSLDGIFKGGMAIWHINENKLTEQNLFDNSVNSDTSDKGVDLVEAANPTLDDNDYANGHEKALFYNTNVNSFGTRVTDISERSSQMTLNIN